MKPHEQGEAEGQALRWYRGNLLKLLAGDERESGLPRWAQDRLAVMRGALRAEAESRRTLGSQTSLGADSIADRERSYELAKPTIERWQEMPNREAYVQSMIASAAYVAYRAGREEVQKLRAEVTELNAELSTAERDHCGCLDTTAAVKTAEEWGVEMPNGSGRIVTVWGFESEEQARHYGRVGRFEPTTFHRREVLPASLSEERQ